MKNNLTAYQQRYSIFHLALRRFGQLFWLLNRYAELERLVEWATRKKLPGPRKAYQQQLFDTEVQLAHYTIRSPQVARWARLIHKICHPTNSPPQNLRKGSASDYRRTGRNDGRKGAK